MSGSWRAALLSGALAAAVALPSVHNGFVEDDVWVVAQRPLLRQPPSFGALLREPWWPRTFGGRLWRPLPLASYALDFRVSASPHWFHAVNVAWAALAAGLLALLAARLLDPRVGLLTGLLFAVHPVHVEATAGVVGRAELMAAVGCAVALLAALRAPPRRRALVAVALGTALAVGSKESGAMVPLAVALVLAWRGARWRAMGPAVACAALPVIVYFALRARLTAGALDAGGLAPGLEGLSLPARAWAMLGVSLEWWRLLLFPVHLSADWSTAQVPVSTALGPRPFLAAGLWIGAAWAARRSVIAAPGVPVGLAWTVLWLIPVSNVLVPTEIVLAERTLYLPSWGAMLALAAAALAVPWRRVVPSVLIVVLSLGALRSLMRAGVWHDADSWFVALQQDAPRSYRTLWMRGDDAFDRGLPGTGERLLREAMRAAPGIPGPAEDLARRYSASGLTAQAEALLRHAMTLNPARTRPWLLLQQVMLAGGDTAGATGVALEAVARYPRDADVLVAALNTLLEGRRCAQLRDLLAQRGRGLPPEVRASAQAHAADCETGAPPPHSAGRPRSPT